MTSKQKAVARGKAAWSKAARTKRAATIAAKRTMEIPLDAIPERPKRAPRISTAGKSVVLIIDGVVFSGTLRRAQ